MEHQPSIDNARLIGKKLKVVWSTRTSDIVTIAVVIENIEKGFQSTTFVEWNKREETILVETDAIPYNATVIVYDRCRESYKSDVYTVNPIFVDPTSVTPPSTPTLPLLPSNVSGMYNIHVSFQCQHISLCCFPDLPRSTHACSPRCACAWG